MSKSFKVCCGIVLLPLAAIALPRPAVAVDVRFLAFGDSITAAWGFDEKCNCEAHECRQACGYPRRLKRLLVAAGVDAGVINEGFGGEKTAEGLTRLDTLLSPGYDVMLLMEGSNDISSNVSPETTIANLREMGRKAAAKGIETVHATLVPRIPEAREDPDNVINADMAGRIRDLAFATGRDLVDPFEVLSTTPELFELYYSHGDSDPVGHPNARGFDLLAAIFFDALQEIDTVPPVAGHVEPAGGTEGVSLLSPVVVRIYDFGVGLDAEASTLLINGEAVEFSSSGGSEWQDLLFRPTSPLPTEVAVRVQSRDLLANAMDREVSRFTTDPEAPGPCIADATTLCIDRDPGDRRFKLTLDWSTALNGGQEGQAQAIPLAPIGLRRGGLFSFFERNNPEVLVKVLDGCAINDRFWVFVAPTTTLGYQLRVVDTVAALRGAARSEYELIVENPDGRDAPPVSDTAAFATCDLDPP